MSIHSLREKFALDAMEPVWTSQGYTVVRNPPSQQLPDFFGSFSPDAIAIGKEPNLVIEVLNPESTASTAKLKQLESLFTERKDWKIEIVYFGSDQVSVDSASSREIKGALDAAEELSGIEPRAALLLAWASLEAIGRRLDAEGTVQALSPRRLIDLLVSLGFASQMEGEELRNFADMRNKIAHGQLNVMPSRQQVLELVGLAKSIQVPS